MEDLDIAIVGAGLGGLYAIHRFRSSGHRVAAFEAGDGIGGTWFWNRYPGARVDIESRFYSYSFSPELDQEWQWTERYAAQAEILRYIQHVADRFDLMPNVRLNHRVDAARFDEVDTRWILTINGDESVYAKYFVLATGNLTEPQMPDIPGLAEFEGRVIHSARWPDEVTSFEGRRVGIIGTGSSGIQIIPEVAKSADRLTVFQRTPNYSIPSRNGPLTDDERNAIKADYPGLRARARSARRGYLLPASTAVYQQRSARSVDDTERRTAYDRAWTSGGAAFTSTFQDIMTDVEANETAAAYVRERISEIVHDPETARKLTPVDYPIGAKRICVDSKYFETYNRQNVDLVSLREEPLRLILRDGITVGDRSVPLDDIVFATGFDAIIGAATRIDIRGVAGATLASAWKGGPHAYLGLAVPGFPNMFAVTGPGSPSVLVNMVITNEQHIDWIDRLLAHMAANGLDRVDASKTADAAWMAEVSDLASRTVFPLANSWYVGANTPGRRRDFVIYAGGMSRYEERCDAIANSGYPGFDFA